jgi:hypothetical protein
MNTDSAQKTSTRRDFVARATYSTPVLLTLPAVAAFAQTGSAGGGSGGAQCATEDEIRQYIIDNNLENLSPEDLGAILQAQFPGGSCDS